MGPHTKHLEHYERFNWGEPEQGQIEYDDTSLVEVAREEYTALTNFIGVLKREREAILSLSLRDLMETNDQKKAIVQTLSILKKRREAYTSRAPGHSNELRDREYRALAGKIRLGMQEARTYLRKNRVLLSMSVGRVKFAMDFIACSLKSGSATYGRETRQGPALFAGRV